MNIDEISINDDLTNLKSAESVNQRKSVKQKMSESLITRI